MLLAVITILALTFTITSAILKKGFLSFAGAGAWIIASVYCFTLHTLAWDTYFCLGFLFIALTLVEFFAPLAYRETTKEGEETEDDDGMQAEFENWNKERNRYSFLYNRRRR